MSLNVLYTDYKNTKIMGYLVKIRKKINEKK